MHAEVRSIGWVLVRSYIPIKVKVFSEGATSRPPKNEDAFSQENDRHRRKSQMGHNTHSHLRDFQRLRCNSWGLL